MQSPCTYQPTSTACRCAGVVRGQNQMCQRPPHYQRFLQGVQQVCDEPLSIANSVQEIRLLDALNSNFGPQSTNPQGNGVTAVPEMRRVSMNDFRPTPDPPGRTATTCLGGLKSLGQIDSEQNMVIFSKEGQLPHNRFPYYAPGQEFVILRQTD